MFYRRGQKHLASGKLDKACKAFFNAGCRYLHGGGVEKAADSFEKGCWYDLAIKCYLKECKTVYYGEDQQHDIKFVSETPQAKAVSVAARMGPEKLKEVLNEIEVMHYHGLTLRVSAEAAVLGSEYAQNELLAEARSCMKSEKTLEQGLRLLSNLARLNPAFINELRNAIKKTPTLTRPTLSYIADVVSPIDPELVGDIYSNMADLMSLPDPDLVNLYDLAISQYQKCDPKPEDKISEASRKLKAQQAEMPNIFEKLRKRAFGDIKYREEHRSSYPSFEASQVLSSLVSEIRNIGTRWDHSGIEIPPSTQITP